MTARVSLQACGCIPPSEIAQALQVGPGSTLQLDVFKRGSVTFTRVSPPAQSHLGSNATCPVP